MNNPITDLLIRFVLVPLFFVLGIVVVGEFAGDQLGISNAAIRIFEVAGGIVALGLYFKSQLLG